MVCRATPNGFEIFHVDPQRDALDRRALLWLVTQDYLRQTTAAIAAAHSVSRRTVQRGVSRARDLTVHWTQERLFRAIETPQFSLGCEAHVHSYVEGELQAYCLRCLKGLERH